MAIVKPFRALRPKDEESAEAMVAPPYDVVSRAEAKILAENPKSFIHVSRAEVDLDDSIGAYDPRVYERAGLNLQKLKSDGTLKREEKPMFYLYSQIMDGRKQTGLVARVSIDDYANGIIKRHELTRIEKEEDRINHFDACDADTEPVFLVCRNKERGKEIIRTWMQEHSPVYDFKTNDGVEHTFWTFDDEALIAEITQLFAETPELYIADGHHRSAAAYKTGLKRRAAAGEIDSDGNYNYFMAVIFPDDELRIFDYNRVVHDFNGLTEGEFMSELGKKFDILPIESGTLPAQKGEFSMYLGGKWHSIRVKPEFVPSGIVESLDVSILQNEVLAPILGIDDPRTDKRISFVGGIRGLDELAARVDAGSAVAFAVCPVSMSTLFAVSDAGEMMPPKSTWFEPKLVSGLFIYEL